MCALPTAPKARPSKSVCTRDERRNSVHPIRVRVWDALQLAEAVFDIGTVPHEATRAAMQHWRGQMRSLGRSRWLAAPSASTMSEWEGSHAFQVLAYRGLDDGLRVNILVLESGTYAFPSPGCFFHDALAEGMVGGEWLRSNLHATAIYSRFSVN